MNLCEQKIAALEHTQRAKLVSSGVAAIASSVMAFMQQGDHAVCIRSSYGWAGYLFKTYLKRFGVDCTFVDGYTVEEFEQAIRPNTKVIYLETFARVNDRSLTGRLVYPIADLFLVQWESLLEFYPKAKYVGGVF